MLTPFVLGLGLFAGLTIFLSIPVARLKAVPPSVRVFLGALTAGILLFLFWDVLSNALAPVTAAALASDWGSTALDGGVGLGGFLLAFLGLTVFERLYRSRSSASAGDAGGPASSVLVTKRAMDLIAVGIGFHNFAEGLAIGAAYSAGGLGFATVLFVGFALHNSTEGFGVVGPALATGLVPSWRRLVALGLVAGGPTFLGTVVGSLGALPILSIGFFAVAAGAILYVVLELVQVGSRRAAPELRAVGIFAGFALGLLTDLLVTVGHV